MPWDFRKDGKMRLCGNNRESLGFIGIIRARQKKISVVICGFIEHGFHGFHG